MSSVCARLRYAKDADFARRHEARLESPVLGLIRLSVEFDTLWKKMSRVFILGGLWRGDLGLAWDGVPVEVGFLG